MKRHHRSAYGAPLHDLDDDEWLQELALQDAERGKGRRGPPMLGLRAGAGAGPAPSPPSMVNGQALKLHWAWQSEPIVVRQPSDLVRLPAAPGVYVILGTNGKPRYVGETRDLRGRFTGRLSELRHIGIPSGECPLSLRIWIARLTSANGAPDRDKERLRLAERLVVRLFSRRCHDGTWLANRSPTRALRPSRAIVAVGQLPPALLAHVTNRDRIAGSTLQLRSGECFEHALLTFPP